MKGIVMFLLFIASYTDIKKRIIDNYVSILMLLIALYTNGLFGVYSNLKSNIIFIIIIMLLYSLNKYGGGDVKLTIALIAFAGSEIYEILLFAAIFSLSFALFIKRKINAELPFAPFLFIGYLLTINCHILSLN